VSIQLKGLPAPSGRAICCIWPRFSSRSIMPLPNRSVTPLFMLYLPAPNKHRSDQGTAYGHCFVCAGMGQDNHSKCARVRPPLQFVHACLSGVVARGVFQGFRVRAHIRFGSHQFHNGLFPKKKAAYRQNKAGKAGTTKTESKRKGAAKHKAGNG
jgi:hypothetical protein